MSEVRSRLNEIACLEGEDFTGEVRSEAGSLEREYKDLETRHRAAVIASGEKETRASEEPDRELRERFELREKASLANYLVAAAQGRMVAGAELELQRAAGVSSGIPVELFDVAKREIGADSPSPAPTSGTGVMVDPIRPAIFARAVLPRLGVAMPRIESGTYSTMTISTSLTAAAVAAGTARESSAATLTPQTSGPHRVTGRLSLRLEDIAQVGVGNFESSLRQNLQLTMSDQLDAYGLTGDGSDPNPQGLYGRLSTIRKQYGRHHSTGWGARRQRRLLRRA